MALGRSIHRNRPARCRVPGRLFRPGPRQREGRRSGRTGLLGHHLLDCRRRGFSEDLDLFFEIADPDLRSRQLRMQHCCGARFETPVSQIATLPSIQARLCDPQRLGDLDYCAAAGDQIKRLAADSGGYGLAMTTDPSG